MDILQRTQFLPQMAHTNTGASTASGFLALVVLPLSNVSICPALVSCLCLTWASAQQKHSLSQNLTGVAPIHGPSAASGGEKTQQVATTFDLIYFFTARESFGLIFITLQETEQTLVTYPTEKCLMTKKQQMVMCNKCQFGQICQNSK